MDIPDESLQERTRRVYRILAAIAKNPALNESLRETTEDTVERLNAALVEGVEETSIPDKLFDEEPIDPPETDESRPFDELFDDDSD